LESRIQSATNENLNKLVSKMTINGNEVLFQRLNFNKDSSFFVNVTAIVPFNNPNISLAGVGLIHDVEFSYATASEDTSFLEKVFAGSLAEHILRLFTYGTILLVIFFSILFSIISYTAGGKSDQRLRDKNLKSRIKTFSKTNSKYRNVFSIILKQNLPARNYDEGAVILRKIKNDATKELGYDHWLAVMLRNSKEFNLIFESTQNEKLKIRDELIAAIDAHLTNNPRP
jgi:hypothetical protein